MIKIKNIKNITALFLGAFIFVSGSTFFAQEADEAFSDSDGQKTEKSADSDEEEPKLLTEAEKAELKKKKQEEKAKAKEAARLAKEKARERTDKYLAVIYVPEKKYTISGANMKAVFKASNGTVCLYGIDEKKHEISLFSKYEDSTSSSLFVKTPGGVYRLNKDAGVKKEVRRTNNGIQLAYYVEKTVQVVEDYEFIPSKPDASPDILKVTVHLTNTGSKKTSLAVKKVFDTILGEGTDYHFTTAAGAKIDSEKMYEDFSKDRAFVSSNLKTSVQIVFDVPDTQKPSRAVLSNISNLGKDPWVFDCVQDRSFHTISAYNNSALGVNWPEVSLESAETASWTYYIGAGLDGDKPAALDYVDSLKKEETPETEEKPAEEKSAEPEKQVKPPVKTDVEVRKTDVEFILPPVTQQQLDPEYIQQLINRINSLQSNPETVDRQEVRQLSAELDAILKIVRQQN